MRRTAVDTLTACSFCGKTAAHDVRIVVGPTVNICSECVALCVDILEENAQAKGAETMGVIRPVP